MGLLLVYTSEATGGACRGASRWINSGALPSAGLDLWFLYCTVSYGLRILLCGPEVELCDEHAA